MKTLSALMMVWHCGERTSHVLFCRTHQHSRSQQASKVKDFLCNVVTRHGRATRKEEQDVAKHTHDAQRDQADAQTLGKAA